MFRFGQFAASTRHSSRSHHEFVSCPVIYDKTATLTYVAILARRGEKSRKNELFLTTFSRRRLCEKQYAPNSRSGSTGPNLIEHCEELRNLGRLEKSLDA